MRICFHSDQRPRLELIPTIERSALLVLILSASCTPRDGDVPTRGVEDSLPPICSPLETAFSPDGSTLAVTDPTGARVWLIDYELREAKEIELNGKPAGVAWTKSGSLIVAEYGAGRAAEIEPQTGRLLRRFSTGLYPDGLAVAPDRNLLLAANSGVASVSIVDLMDGEEIRRVPVPREPERIAIAPDESLAIVTNLLPAGRADTPDHAAAVSLINLDDLDECRDVLLPAGSTNVRGIAVDARGRWAYAVHSLARSNVPTTQLESGWIMTSAMSIIDLDAAEVYATLLLDHPLEGAADPWGVAISPDGSMIWITLSGVHQLARIDVTRLHDYLAGGLPGDDPLSDTGAYAPGTENIWLQIRRDPARRAELVNDLTALYSGDLIQRFDLDGRGPRGLAVHPSSGSLAVASHFTGEVLLLESNGTVTARIPLGLGPEPDQAMVGRELFHDATLCFQHWLSCASCHPNEGRVDGMNWDNLNDGVGNPKNLKSLLLAQETPPMMWRGIREDMEIAAGKGFDFFGQEAEPSHIVAVRAYIRSLTPEPSPYRSIDGTLTPAAKRGRKLFLAEESRCAQCHPSPLWTDLQMHDVGTGGPLDHDVRFDTPGLTELYRTAPYLHDGRSAALRDVLTVDNDSDRHGVTSQLSDEELEDLIAFLRSL